MINNNTKSTVSSFSIINIPLMRTVTLGFPLIHLTSVDSTNKYAAGILRQENATEGTVILADVQTHGKGQGNNTWLSDNGLNLLFSLILKPDFLPAFKQVYLSMCIATGINDFITDLGIRSQVKWPNDILVKGKKVAGILIENTILSQNLHTSIVGIGLNVNQVSFPPEIPNPASLAGETGKSYDVGQLLERLLLFLEKRLNQLYAEDFVAIKSQYLNSLWLLNTRARFTDQKGVFEGRIIDVAESGELLILTSGGETKMYGFKEVEFQE
jgi:BirA family transcriptional regulator, biotin operon repressor / biotin---[acetyl-CoA-carboxylase] ligase